MSFDFPLRFQVIQFFALLVRIGVIVFLGIPALSSARIPGPVKMAITTVTAVILIPVLPDSWQAPELYQFMSLGGLLYLVASEFTLGLFVSLIIRMMIEVVGIAGLIIDRNLGYSMATVLDPTMEDQSTIISSFMIQVFLMLFLITDVHLILVKLAAESLRTIPPGQFILQPEHHDSLLYLGTDMFRMGFQIALPIFTIILFINVAMALMARFGEEFEVMMLSFPLRLGLGLGLLMALAPVYCSLFRGINDQMIEWISAVLKIG